MMAVTMSVMTSLTVMVSGVDVGDDGGKLSEAADETIESFSQQLLTFLDLPFRL